MKMAISFPNTLYEKAEETASYIGIPRSQLFAMALEEFISNHNGKMITEKINEVYEKIDQTEFELYLNVGLEPLRNVTKNDTW
jgi:metal-responsive CopG/Arc/MetJ family transcriptional regulator